MKKQQFKTVDLVVVILMIVFVSGIAMGILRHNQGPSPKSQALRMAENISSQLMNLDRKKFHSLGPLADGTERIPSSEESKKQAIRLGPEGIIGQDPWGQPFQYRFVENPEGEFSHLIVWSVGPDSHSSKSISDWTWKDLQAFGASPREVHLDDDLGLIYALSN